MHEEIARPTQGRHRRARLFGNRINGEQRHTHSGPKDSSMNFSAREEGKTVAGLKIRSFSDVKKGLLVAVGISRAKLSKRQPADKAKLEWDT